MKRTITFTSTFSITEESSNFVVLTSDKPEVPICLPGFCGYVAMWLSHVA
jgi:hypothetical protein